MERLHKLQTKVSHNKTNLPDLFFVINKCVTFVIITTQVIEIEEKAVRIP